MSGGTLIALAADEIVLGEFSMLGPIDPQIAGLPAASIVKARDSKPIEGVFDLTALAQSQIENAKPRVERRSPPRTSRADAASRGGMNLKAATAPINSPMPPPI
jgi:serine dehydrogenase proteinase